MERLDGGKGIAGVRPILIEDYRDEVAEIDLGPLLARDQPNLGTARVRTKDRVDRPGMQQPGMTSQVVLPAVNRQCQRHRNPLQRRIVGVVGTGQRPVGQASSGPVGEDPGGGGSAVHAEPTTNPNWLRRALSDEASGGAAPA
jgi:hypothetical protein